MRSKLLVLSTVVLVSGCITDLSIDAPPAPLTCDPVGLEPLADAFPDCDLGTCGPAEADRERGRCVDTNQVPEAQRGLLAPCANGYSLCVPLDVLLTGGRHAATTCESIGGAEGRCTSECVPAVKEQAAMLPVDVCAEGERCAPCYDPVSGESTGACEGVCDAPVEPPYLFVDCCSGRAECVPDTAVPESKRASLSQDSCPQSTDLCVPREFTDPSFVPPACTHDLGLGAGACISTCIADANNLGDPDTECPTDTKCVPCSIAGSSTGACDW